jgi:hypothetical protein
MADLRKQGIVTKVRALKSGTKVGGIPFTRGPLAHLLRNRFYIGEVTSQPLPLQWNLKAETSRSTTKTKAKQQEKATRRRKGKNVESEQSASATIAVEEAIVRIMTLDK